MDDVSTRCRQQLASFRIRELKDVLARLGLPKQGKKQALMDKIMGVIVPVEKPNFALKGFARGAKSAASREECVNVIDDIFRKLRGAGALDLASSEKKDLGAGSSSLARSEGPDEPASWGEAKTRCPCGVSKDQGVMIQCDDSKCGVWQHMTCVVIPEKPGEGPDPEVPSQFYCELCRVNRSDPFCVTLQSPLASTKLSIAGTKAEGTTNLQSVEKTFQLSQADRELAHRPGHDLQVWCVLMNDKVPFRMHWPQYSDLRMNGASVRVTNRPGQQLLGANGRDEGPGILFHAREGMNRISFTAYDGRPFCLGIRIIRRNSLQQVFAMIPDVSEGEKFEEALARVRRCIHGGVQGAAEDDDSDLEVVADSITANLRCPMSGSRIKVAGRFKPCLHMGCFDLHTFVELNQRARKWQCPICLKNYSLEHLIIDPFVNRVTSALKSYAEDVTEVELKADGHWRPKAEGERSCEPWRSPDGIVAAANGVLKNPHQSESLVPVKIEEEHSSQERGSLRIGMKRSHDGQWAINGAAKRANGWASNNAAGPSHKPQPRAPAPIIHPTIISQSSSATGSNENGEDGERSVGQEPSEKNAEVVHLLQDTGLSSSPKKSDKGKIGQSPSKRGAEAQPPADLIVLSDTDEDEGDNLMIGSSADALKFPESETVARPARPLSLSLEPDELLVDVPQVFPKVNSTRVGNGSIAAENTQPNGGTMGVPLEPGNFWSPQLRAAAGVPYNNYFSSSSELTTSVSALHPPIRPTAMQAVAPPQQHGESISRGSSWKFGRPSSTTAYSNTECNGSGSDGGNGTSPPRESPLQLFLPHQPARAQVQSSLREPHISSEDVDGWFSLSLGGCDSVLDAAPKRDTNRTSQTNGCGPLDSLGTVAASEVLLGMSTNGAHTPADNSKSPIQHSPQYFSPVECFSPAPSSPPLGRNYRVSPIRSISPVYRHRSPNFHRHRNNYFSVESDSD